MADKKCIGWPLEEQLTNKTLYELFYSERMLKTSVHLMPDCALILEELVKKRDNLTMLHGEHSAKCVNARYVPYWYTQFCDAYSHLGQEIQSDHATICIRCKPGDAMDVVWAGGTLPVTNPVIGKMSPAYLFIAILLCNGYAYS